MKTNCIVSKEKNVETSMELIEKIVEVRENRGLSQKQLSALSGVTQPVIARMEKSVHSPQLNTLLKILDPLGYTLEIVPKH